MSVDDMPRKMAERHFRVRAAKVMADIRSLPLQEQLRVAADLIEKDKTNGRRWALAIARHVVADLRSGGA